MAELNIPIPAIYCHDNLDILRNINSESVDLVYLDPPFNTGKQFRAPVGSQAEGANFSDIWEPESAEVWQLLELVDTNPDLFRYIDMVDVFGSRSARWYMIFMALRLIDIHRILKPTGSVYLHCDPTSSYLLRTVLDYIFGSHNFRNEIVWRIGWVSGYKTTRRGWIRNHDIILYYTKSVAATHRFNKEYIPYPAGYTRRDGNPPTGKGIPIEDTWNCSDTDRLDSVNIMSFSPETIGYPTQKPIKLLERIIKASTNEGDIVLDPFCGRATTCIAAHKLNRRWIGIDVSKMAYTLVKDRLEREASQGQLTDTNFTSVKYFDYPPARTDLGDIPPLQGKRMQQVRQDLYDSYGGQCKACHEYCQESTLHLDYIRAKRHNGSDHPDNLQLICRKCAALKATKPVDYLLHRLAKQTPRTSI